MSIAVPLYGFGASGGGSGGTLTVTAPANVTVTVSKDGKTKTKNSGTSGVVVFKGLASGTWTLTITDGSQTSSKPVVITADYSTVIAFFAATINITYPAGSTCTCSDGTTTLSAPDTSGTWACIIPNAGHWSVHCSNGVESDTKSVDITTDGQHISVELAYWNGELYDSGNQFVAVTGGWNKCNWKSYDTESISLPSVTYNADSVTISKSKSNGTSGGWCTVNKIDLSGYNTIRFVITNCYMTGSEVSLFATENVEGGISSAASRVKVGSNGAKEMAIDISNVNKSCYVGIGISTYQDYDANITVSKIILE